jgi:transposase
MTIHASQATDAELSTPDVFFGVDVSKATFDVAWRKTGLPPAQLEEIRKMKTRTFKRTRQGVEEWWQCALRILEPGQTAAVVMEVTSSFSLELATWLKATRPAVQVSILPGKRVRDWAQGIGIDDKDDDIDARVLACYGSERRPPSSALVDGLYGKLRALSRARLGYVEHVVALRQQLNEQRSEHIDPATSKMLQKSLSKVLACFEKQIEEVEKKMKELIKEDEQLAADVKLLDTIAGVGWHTAVTVLVEVGDLRNFLERTKVVSMVGLNPVIRKSGTSVHKRPRISKKGSSRARRALYLAALSTVGKDNPFSRMYEDLVRRGKKKMVALVAVMRKLILVMRAVLISGKPYDPYYTRAGAV